MIRPVPDGVTYKPRPDLLCFQRTVPPSPALAAADHFAPSFLPTSYIGTDSLRILARICVPLLTFPGQRCSTKALACPPPTSRCRPCWRPNLQGVRFSFSPDVTLRLPCMISLPTPISFWGCNRARSVDFAEWPPTLITVAVACPFYSYSN